MLCSASVRFGVGLRPSATQSYVLESGRTHQGDLVVVARSVDLREGSTVDGDVAVVAFENAALGGTINGDLALFASGVDVYFRNDFRVRGDLAVCARSLNNLTLDRISGEIDKGCDQLSQALRRYGVDTMGLGFSGVDFSTFLPFFRGYGDIGQVIVNTIVVGLLAALAAAVVPYHYQRITQAAIATTLSAGMVGFLTIAASLVLSVVYSVLGLATLGVMLCLGLPLMAVVWIVLYLALLLGWIAVAFPVGKAIMRALGLRYSRLQAALLGAATITFGQGVLSLLPCVGVFGWLILVVAGSVGLGAVLLTRAGLRPYPEVIAVKSKISFEE